MENLNRIAAIRWWNTLSIVEKRRLVTECLGEGRVVKSLTGGEIERIWDGEVKEKEETRE